MKRKKTVFIITFVLIILLSLLSGCIIEGKIPVATLYAHEFWDDNSVSLHGRFAYPLCNANNTKFVYDTESHENWEEYQFTIGADIYKEHFSVRISADDLIHYKTYYFRAVAYCYNFKGPLKDYEEGYYSGIELTFYINWN
jgi:hypothetical protein